MSKPNRREFDVCSAFFRSSSSSFASFFFVCLAVVLCGNLLGVKCTHLHTLNAVALFLFYFILFDPLVWRNYSNWNLLLHTKWIEYIVSFEYIKRGHLAFAWVCLFMYAYVCCCCCFPSGQHIKTVSLFQFSWFQGNRIRITISGTSTATIAFNKTVYPQWIKGSLVDPAVD